MAELSEYIAPIIAPDLGSPEFSMSLVEAFNTIDSNFKKIIQAPYLKGDRGASIETVVLKKPDHVVEGNPSEYEILQDAIIRRLNSVYYPGCDPVTQGVCHDALLGVLPDAGVNSADKLVQEDHFTVFKDFSTNEMYLICPYVFIDARIQYLDRITENENNRQKFIDTSSIVTGKYTRNNEGVYRWTIDISTNIPKLYFDDQSGYYCWLVNNEKTGIIAQGVKGKNGIDGNITICRGIKEPGTENSESRIVIKGVYQQQTSIDESNGQSISSTVYGWTDISEANIDLENRPVLVYGYDSESDYNNPPKYIQFSIAFVEDIVGDTTEDAGGTSTPNASKQYYIVYVSNLDLVKIIRENSIAKLLETISSSGSVQGLYISSEKDGNTIQNVHMFWNDSDNKAHLSKVPYSCVTRGVQDSDRIRGSKLHIDYDTTEVGDLNVQGVAYAHHIKTSGDGHDQIMFQSSQGVIQGSIGLQGIQSTSSQGSIECNLALVPSFNVRLVTEPVLNGTGRTERQVLHIPTPWIGYKGPQGGGNDTVVDTLYEACQLTDESGSNEIVMDVTKRDNDSSFWTEIHSDEKHNDNDNLGIRSVFVESGDTIGIHVFEQYQRLYSTVLTPRNSGDSTSFERYYLDFVVQVILIRNVGSSFYATIAYKLPRITNKSVGGDDYKNLIDVWGLPSDQDTSTYLVKSPTIYFDVIMVSTTGRDHTLRVLKPNDTYDHTKYMFRWVTLNSNLSNDREYIIGYEEEISGWSSSIPVVGTPMGSIFYIDEYGKKSVTTPRFTPIVSDCSAMISTRPDSTKTINLQSCVTQGSSIINQYIIAIYPRSDIYMNNYRYGVVRDPNGYNIFSLSVTGTYGLSFYVIATDDHPIYYQGSSVSDVMEFTRGFTSSKQSTMDLVAGLQGYYAGSVVHIPGVYSGPLSMRFSNNKDMTTRGFDDVIFAQFERTSSQLPGGGIMWSVINEPLDTSYFQQLDGYNNTGQVQGIIGLQGTYIGVQRTSVRPSSSRVFYVMNREMSHRGSYIQGTIRLVNKTGLNLKVYKLQTTITTDQTTSGPLYDISRDYTLGKESTITLEDRLYLPKRDNSNHVHLDTLLIEGRAQIDTGEVTTDRTTINTRCTILGPIGVANDERLSSDDLQKAVSYSLYDPQSETYFRDVQGHLFHPVKPKWGRIDVLDIADRFRPINIYTIENYRVCDTRFCDTPTGDNTITITIESTGSSTGGVRFNRELIQTTRELTISTI